MKIKRNEPSQLILENNPVLLALALTLFALLFIGIGLANIGTDPVMGLIFTGGGLVFGIGFSMAFIRRTQLILDRQSGLVELRRRSWFGYSKMIWELRHLSEAYVQTSNSGDTPTHRAALVIDGGMDAGTHPVTLVYSSGSGARRATKAINDWLDSNRHTP